MKRRSLLVGLAAAAWPTRVRAEPASARVVLASFTTLYPVDAEHKARARNIELAAEAIDGRVLAPGATLSFNAAVGERTAAFGYERAVVLRDGMIAEGAGGGTCQVASTLHAAALLAGLAIGQRAPHTRPSAYIRMGLDATVSFGRIDLSVRNPRPSPVTVRTRAGHGELTVTVHGQGEVPVVTLTSEIVERLPFATERERDPSIRDDNMHRIAYGIPGYRVRRDRTVRVGDDQRDETRIDFYPPTPAVLRARDLRRVDPDALDEASAEIVEPGAIRPLLVQLRPSTKVTLANR